MNDWPNTIAAVMTGLGLGLGFGLAWRRGGRGAPAANVAGLPKAEWSAALRTLGSSVTQPAWLTRADGTIHWANRAWREYAGEEPGRKALGTRWPELCAGESAKLAEMRRAENESQPGSFFFLGKVARAAAEARWHSLRASVLRDRAGEAFYFILLSDEHERVGSEEALRQEADRFRMVAEAIPHLLWRANVDGVPDYGNQNFVDYLGIPPEELYGSGWTSVIHPEDRDRVLAEWRRSRVDGSLFQK